MNRYIRRSKVVTAEVYRLGLEDGLAYEDTIPGFITDGMFAASIVDGVRLYPYLNIKGNRAFIEAGDYIVREKDGSRHVVPAHVIKAIYELIHFEDGDATIFDEN